MEATTGASYSLRHYIATMSINEKRKSCILTLRKPVTNDFKMVRPYRGFRVITLRTMLVNSYDMIILQSRASQLFTLFVAIVRKESNSLFPT